jgi:prolyl 4-hydroxylase
MERQGRVPPEAWRLAAAGRRGEAILLVQRLAAEGDADALFTLAEWRLIGQIVPQDLAQARALYRRAGEAGLLQGAIFHTNLLASGVGGPSDWAGALERLRGEARADPQRRRALALIEAMKLGDDGAPAAAPAGRRLSESPHVTMFPKLFSAAECRYLVEIAEPGFAPSVVVDAATGETRRDPLRTSEGSTMHWLLADPVVEALNRRLAAASGTKVGQGEPLQILRYRPGQEYRLHLDAIPGKANQRIMTALVWLNEAYEGGETRFVETELQAKGGTGDAILFRNVLGDGRPDPASKHAGLPVTRGTKLLASRWICERPHALPRPPG